MLSFAGPPLRGGGLGNDHSEVPVKQALGFSVILNHGATLLFKKHDSGGTLFPVGFPHLG